MQLTDKNGNLIEFKTFQEDEKSFRTCAYSQEGKKMGFVNFKFLNENKVWLYQIATYEDFRNQGIGALLLDVMEYISAVQNNCTHVQGKFHPTSVYAEQFYKKNGYKITIYNDYYPLVEKKLEKEKINQNFKQKTLEEPKIEETKRTQIQTIVNSCEKSTKIKKNDLEF